MIAAGLRSGLDGVATCSLGTSSRLRRRSTLRATKTCCARTTIRGRRRSAVLTLSSNRTGPRTDVRKRVKVEDVAVRIHRRSLRWLGRVIRKGPFDQHGRPYLEYMTLRMQLWPEHATVQTGQPRKNWNGQMAVLTDRILAAANSLVQEHQQEWRHWEEVAQSQETWDTAVAMVLAEVEAQASVDTHERRHAEKETASGGTALGTLNPGIM